MNQYKDNYYTNRNDWTSQPINSTIPDNHSYDNQKYKRWNRAIFRNSLSLFISQVLWIIVFSICLSPLNDIEDKTIVIVWAAVSGAFIVILWIAFSIILLVIKYPQELKKKKITFGVLGLFFGTLFPFIFTIIAKSYIKKNHW